MRVQGTLFDHVITSKSAWKLKGSVVTISLQKLSKNSTWATLFLATDGTATRAAPAPASTAKKLMQCLHDYEATDPLELSFREGDVIVVIQENNTGWWKGELDGVVGLFPSNFTEELPANQAVSAEYSEEVEELDDATANVVTPSLSASAKAAPKAAAAAVAAASAAAQTAAPAAGAKPPAGAVAVMRPVMGGPTGKPAPLKSPSAYTPSPSSPTAAAAPKPAPILSVAAKPPATAVVSRVVAPASAAPKGGASAGRPALEGSNSAELSPSGGGDKPQVRAMYNFVAQERGELSLRENDVVVLLKKDDSGWWQGSVTYTGWFPASFVEEITD